MHRNVIYTVLLLLSSHLYASGSHMNFGLTENKFENGVKCRYWIFRLDKIT
jgi:hypothetical protein